MTDRLITPNKPVSKSVRQAQQHRQFKAPKFITRRLQKTELRDAVLVKTFMVGNKPCIQFYFLLIHSYVIGS